MTDTLNQAQRTPSQLAASLRSAEAELHTAHAQHAAARSRLPALHRIGDAAKLAGCNAQIAEAAKNIAALNETAEGLREAVKLAEASEIEAANVRSFEAINKAVRKAAENTKALDELIVQFGAAITEWNDSVSAANHALQSNGISPLRDMMSVTSVLNLLQLNLYVQTDGVMGKAVTLDNIHQLREIIKKRGYASLPAAADTYQAATLRHAKIHLGLARPEAA